MSLLQNKICYYKSYLRLWHGITPIALALLIGRVWPAFCVCVLPLALAFYFLRPYKAFLLSLIIGLFIAFPLGIISNNEKRLSLHQPYSITQIKAEVLEDSRSSPSGQYFTPLKLKQVSSYWVSTEAKGRVRLFHKGQSLYQGQIVRVTGNLSTEHPSFYANQIEVMGFSKIIFKKRKDFKEWFTAYSKPKLGKSFGLFTALTTGDHNLIDPITQKVFVETGLNYQLVLSGWHLGLLLALIFFVLKFLGRRRAGLWAIPLLLVYWLLSGLQYSLGRAVIMAIVAVICYLFYIRIRSIDLLSLSFVAILIADPVALESLSFQFSYLAMLGIILFMKPLSQLSRKWLWGFKNEGFSLALAAHIPLAPALFYYFGKIYPISLFLGLFSSLIIASFMLLGLLVVVIPLHISLLTLLMEGYYFVIIRVLYYLSFFPQASLL